MKTRRIAVLTTCRADYGLLRNVIIKLNQAIDIEVSILVTGSHLEKQWGATINEIFKDNVKIAGQIPVYDCEECFSNVSLVMANVLTKFSKLFLENTFDLLLVLGDRYETMAVCIAAVNARIPIAHIHGGEITEGAVDDCYRHAITKMSYLHFTSMDEYRERVIQLGESPDRVFNVGALGVENALNTAFMSKAELENSINFSLGNRYAVVTFHPITLEESSISQIYQLLEALREQKEFRYIITYANADNEGDEINKILMEYVQKTSNCFLVQSLGRVRYLSALKYSSMVIGNSSSGIIEAPSFHVPTVNIGDRQGGRIQAQTVINCKPEKEDIVKAIRTAIHKFDSGKIGLIENPYEKAGTSDMIVKILLEKTKQSINIKKKFYDIKKNM